MHCAKILMIEDNKSDVDYLIYGFKKNHIKNYLEVIYDGSTAIDFITRCDNPSAIAHQEVILPDLILLDMNLPRVHGVELIQAILASPTLSSVPILIVTASLTKELAQTAMTYGAVGIMEKPVKIDELIKVLSSLPGFALSIVHTGT